MSADAGTPRAACELLALARHRLAQGQFDPLLADDIARFLAGGRKRSAVETADLLRAVEIPPNHVAAMEAQTGDDHPADDPRLHREAADAVLGLRDNGAPEPAIPPAPPRPYITRKRLEEMVEGAFRFDDIRVTALRIGEHVVKQLGIEIVEEG